MVILQYQSGNTAFVNCIRDSRFCKQIEWFQRLAWWPQGSSISHHVLTFKGILIFFFSLSPESLTGQPTNPSRGLMESLPPNISIKLDLKFWVPLLLRVFKSCLKQICPGFYSRMTVFMNNTVQYNHRSYHFIWRHQFHPIPLCDELAAKFSPQSRQWLPQWYLKQQEPLEYCHSFTIILWTSSFFGVEWFVGPKVLELNPCTIS